MACRPVCSRPAQLSLDGLRMAFGASLVLRPFAWQGSRTGQHACARPASSSFTSKESVPNCPVHSVHVAEGVL